MLINLGFSLTVVDERAELLSHQAFSQAQVHLADSSVFGIRNLDLTERCFVVVCTHDHGLDQAIVEEVIKHPVKYLALVGSERKNFFCRKRMLAKNFEDHVVNKLICPAGLPINAQSPSEIAVSIAAQMIQVRNEENLCHDRSSRPEPAHGLA